MSQKSNFLNSVKVQKPFRNRFDMSHDVKMTLDMGWLTPTACIECIPGDNYSIGCDTLLRFLPMVAPVMHRMDVSMHYFFVPNRLLWSNWENFITNTPVAGSAPAFPTITINDANTAIGSLGDYLGLPQYTTGVAREVSAMPFAAVQKVWNDFYRDQNLQTDIAADILLTDGDNSGKAELVAMRRRAWEHDLFTAALPFAQKGAAVDLPLGEVKLKDDLPFNEMYLRTNQFGVNVNGPVSGEPTTGILNVDTGVGGKVPVSLDPNGNYIVDATTINDLRTALALQKFLEKQARGGTRYAEQLRVQFGIKPSDARLQRPEYITGTKSPVIISEVLQNSSSDASTPQGNMAGHGLSVAQGKYGSYYCQEHGFIIGLMSVMPKTAYMQGIEKHWLKINDLYQYFWPDMANLGEEAVTNQEIYAYTPTAEETFGYLPRYYDYRMIQNRVAGEMRTTLDFWHLARKFANQPALNAEFIECVPDDRIFAAPTTQNLVAHVLHKISCSRLIPKYGTPTF